MHSSRMHTARSLTVSPSICQGRHACHACPPPCTPHFHACPPPCMPLPHMTPTMHPPAMHVPHVDRILDTRFWKYYLAPTSLQAVIRKHSSRMRTACLSIVSASQWKSLNVWGVWVSGGPCIVIQWDPMSRAGTGKRGYRDPWMVSFSGHIPSPPNRRMIDRQTLLKMLP